MKVHVLVTGRDVEIANMVLDLTALLAFGPAALKALLTPGNQVILTPVVEEPLVFPPAYEVRP